MNLALEPGVQRTSGRRVERTTLACPPARHGRPHVLQEAAATGSMFMNVAAILKHKGRDVATIPPTLTLVEAARRLTQRRIGALVVVDEDGGIAGILSERDIVRALAEEGTKCLDRPVAETMTREVVTCHESDTLDELMSMMTTRRFRHMPVLAGGDLVGIVSIGDVVKHHVAEIEMEATAMRAYIAHG